MASTTGWRSGLREGRPGGASGESRPRRQEILRADPYYPHTGWRAAVAWLAYFFFFLGLTAFIILMVPDHEFGWYYVTYTAAFATFSVIIQFLSRRARSRMLENTGQIPPAEKTAVDDSRG
ncbi:MAG: hypothetical protein KH989_03655 [Kocuria rhizophila]|nr:hypothetical protein [Kocuria rhizophila]